MSYMKPTIVSAARVKHNKPQLLDNAKAIADFGALRYDKLLTQDRLTRVQEALQKSGSSEGLADIKLLLADNDREIKRIDSIVQELQATPESKFGKLPEKTAKITAHVIKRFKDDHPRKTLESLWSTIAKATVSTAVALDKDHKVDEAETKAVKDAARDFEKRREKAASRIAERKKSEQADQKTELPVSRKRALEKPTREIGTKRVKTDHKDDQQKKTAVRKPAKPTKLTKAKEPERKTAPAPEAPADVDITKLIFSSKKRRAAESEERELVRPTKKAKPSEAVGEKPTKKTIPLSAKAKNAPASNFSFTLSVKPPKIRVRTLDRNGKVVPTVTTPAQTGEQGAKGN